MPLVRFPSQHKHSVNLHVVCFLLSPRHRTVRLLSHRLLSLGIDSTRQRQSIQLVSPRAVGVIISFCFGAQYGPVFLFFFFLFSVFSFQLCVHSGCSVFAPALLAVDVLYFVVPLSHTQRDFNLCQPSLFLSPLQKGATHTMFQRALSCSTNAPLHIRTPFQSQHFVTLTVRNSQTRLHQ